MKLMKLDQVQTLYAELNARYWSGELPRDLKLVIVPDGKAGRHLNGELELGTYSADPPRIELNSLCLRISNHLLPAVLLHEMIHARLGVGKLSSHRSDAWKAEVARLSQLGALCEVL